MPANTVYLADSNYTTRFTSGVSIDGALTLLTASGLLGQFSTLVNTTQIGNMASFNSLLIGAGTVGQTLISASSVTLVATTAVATKSTETTFTHQLARVGDMVTWGMGTSTSSLSAGLSMDMFVSANSTITIRLSNCSAANAAQPAISVVFKVERFAF